MRLSYSTNAFVRFSLMDALTEIGALGFKGVEIMCDRPHLYPPDFDADAIAAVRQGLIRSGLTPTNLNGFTLFAVGTTHLPSWIEPDASRRDIRIRHTLDCIRVAAMLKCPNISIPPGGPLSGKGRSQDISLFHQGLEAVLPEAEARGITLLIEPEPDLLIETSSQAVSFMSDIRSSRIGLNFDIGHFYCVGEDPAAAFETLFQWVGHVHIEDIAHNRRHEHLIPGRGAIDFASVFRAMVRLEYSGDICLELYPYTDLPVAAGKEGMEYLLPILKASGLSID